MSTEPTSERNFNQFKRKLQEKIKNEIQDKPMYESINLR